MDLIVLRGRRESGKTTTIVKAWDLLKAHPGVTVINDKNPASPEVHRGVLEIDGVRVGITSQGDAEKYLKPAIAYLISQGCVVIVCATRTFGETVDFVNGLGQQGWRIDWIRKKWQALDDDDRATEIRDKVLAAVQQTVPVVA